VAVICAITVATDFVDLASAASTLALMLGLVVAIDHALFIVSRYRGEIRDGHEPEEAAGRALGTAGSAVVFAGLTVVIALAGLCVIGIMMLTTMGLAAAFAVLVAVVIALTLLPAVLGFAGTEIMNGKLKTRRIRPRSAARARRWGCAGAGSSPATRSRCSSPRWSVSGCWPFRRCRCASPCPTTAWPPRAAPSASPTTP
jgi:putative drug exporter of the RND superfamily